MVLYLYELCLISVDSYIHSQIVRGNQGSPFQKNYVFFRRVPCRDHRLRNTPL